MPSVPKTLLGTSKPISLSHPKSVAYFPTGAARLGVQGDGSIFSANPTVLAWNLSVGVNWFVFLGMVGPAIALSFQIEGTHDANSIEVEVSDDEIEGGFLLGFTAGVSVGLSLKQAELKWVSDGWNSHVETVWNSALNLSLNLQFDLIEIILSLVLKLLGEHGKTNTILHKVDNFNSQLLASYGLFDSVSGGFEQGGGKLSVSPSFSLPVNLAQYIPGLSQINTSLEAMMGGFFVGPTVGVALPCTVHLTEIQMAGKTFSNLKFNGSKVTGTATGPGVAGLDIQVGMTRTPGLDFTLGFGATISVLKLFSLGGNISVNVLALLGLSINLGTFPFTLKNTLGSDRIVGGDSSFRLAEVILEEPATA